MMKGFAYLAIAVLFVVMVVVVIRPALELRNIAVQIEEVSAKIDALEER